MSEVADDLYSYPIYQHLLDKLPSKYIKEWNTKEFPRRILLQTLAADMGFTQYTVWRWMKGVNFGKKAIAALVEISNNTDEAEKKGLIKVEDLASFMLNS